MVLNNLVKLGTDCLGIGKVAEAFFGYLGERDKHKYALQEPARNKEMIESVGDAISKHSDLDVRYEANGLSISEKSLESLEARAELRQRNREIKKQKNLETVVDYSCEELKNETDISPEPLDEQWSTRFFDYVCDVSTEDLQIIWAKILAGEVKHPKSFSLRTLEVLRNLSQDEAKLFVELSSFLLRIDNIYVLTTDDYLLDKYNINYGDLIKLSDSGILNLHGAICEPDLNGQISGILSSTKTQSIHVKSKSEEPIYIGLDTRLLTRAGVELMSILPTIVNEDFFTDFAKIISMSYKDLDVLLHTPNGVKRFK